MLTTTIMSMVQAVIQDSSQMSEIEIDKHNIIFYSIKNHGR